MTTVSKKQRSEWEDELKKDYPNINPWFLKIVMDTYCDENGKSTIDQLVKNHIREERKGKKPVKVVPKETEVFQGEVKPWGEEWELKMQKVNEAVNAKVVEVVHNEKNNIETIVE